ncbi:hypothetical protein, partial [Brevundimonas diminuta]|uniref:hypothetical protein n=1 Tax=Brevundimonas diminuta TaxID=293 RepID=UPI001C63C196
GKGFHDSASGGWRHIPIGLAPIARLGSGQRSRFKRRGDGDLDASMSDAFVQRLGRVIDRVEIIAPFIAVDLDEAGLKVGVFAGRGQHGVESGGQLFGRHGAAV